MINHLCIISSVQTLETITRLTNHASHLQACNVLIQSFQLLICTPDAEDGAMTQGVLDHVVEHKPISGTYPAQLSFHSSVQHDDFVLDIGVVHDGQTVLAEAINQ